MGGRELRSKTVLWSRPRSRKTAQKDEHEERRGTGTRKVNVDVRSTRSILKNKRLQMLHLSSKKRESSKAAVKENSILAGDGPRKRKKNIQIDSHDISKEGFDKGTGTRKFGVDVRSSQSLPKNKRLQMRDLSSRKRETSLGAVRTKSILADDRSRERKKSIQIDSHDISNKGLDDGTGTRKFGVDVRSSQSLPKNKRPQMRDLSSRKRETSLGAVRTKSILADDRSRERKKSIQIDSHDISNKGLDDGTKTSKVGASSIKKKKGLEMLDTSNRKIETSGRGMDAKSILADARPRKRKKIIRICSHDISNKRLDDSIPVNEKVVEMSPLLSKNAQFRAIQPSPSILSFVEDNLLGRRRLIDLRRAGYNVKLSAPLDNIPFSTNEEREKIEENVFRNKLTFFAAAKVSSSLPSPEIPEIAFAGRSNVGKSSLLNALTRQWGVVRTSDKPGLTQTINFFKLASKICLVDLPGYGFAYAKEEVKDAWEELVKEYVSTRTGLKRVCLLIDTQWGIKPRDHELIDLMERSQTKYQIVLTKTDVVFPINVARRAMQIEENLKVNKSMVKPVMMVSSKSGAGIRSLRTVLANVVRFAK